MPDYRRDPGQFWPPKQLKKSVVHGLIKLRRSDVIDSIVANVLYLNMTLLGCGSRTDVTSTYFCSTLKWKDIDLARKYP